MSFLTVEFLAIKCLLCDRLQRAVYLQGKILGMVELTDLLSEVKCRDICLQGYDDASILYRSAIALRLSRSWQLAPLDLARELTTYLRDLPDFQIGVVPPGWIQFRLRDSSLADWLQLIARTSPLINPEWVSSVKGDRLGYGETEVFAWQYAHARCCSLLRLADRQGTISLSPPHPEHLPRWRVLSPDPIPWLTPDDRFRLVHPAERAVICQLLAAVDDLCCPPAKHRLRTAEKLVEALSQRFLRFYRVCRIWGEMETREPELARARLGLAIATRQVLRVLLQEVLGVFAPTEL